MTNWGVNLRYTEVISKTNNGGLIHLRNRRKVVRAYKNLTNVERCPVELYKRYLSHVPNEVSDNAFYLLALPKPNGEIWNYKRAAGRETLGNVAKKIMKPAQLDGRDTNHSLRRSCATRLYDTGFPEQLIQETTGQGLSTLSEHINVPHRHSKGKQPKFCWVFFQKRL